MQVFSFFKEVVVGSFKDEERKRASRWIQGTSLCVCIISHFMLYNVGCVSFPEVHKDSVDIEKLLMDAVEHRSALLLSVKTYCKKSIYFCVCFPYALQCQWLGCCCGWSGLVGIQPHGDVCSQELK